MGDVVVTVVALSSSSGVIASTTWAELLLLAYRDLPPHALHLTIVFFSFVKSMMPPKLDLKPDNHTITTMKIALGTQLGQGKAPTASISSLVMAGYCSFCALVIECAISLVRNHVMLLNNIRKADNIHLIETW